MKRPFLIQMEGELFEQVQGSGLFKDSKTFVDALPKSEPEALLAVYQEEKNNEAFDLQAFVDKHFSLPRAAQDEGRHPLDLASVESYISSLWPRLRREVDDHHTYDTLIPLQYPYIVPGGRFREIFYWDSYFTMLGLADIGEFALIEAMIQNLVDLQDRLGHIPNGNRWYFVTRSQPPFLSLMLSLLWDKVYEEKEGGLEHMVQYLPALEKEHAFWMQDERTVQLADDMVLNHYWDSSSLPRQEAYKEDVHIANISGRDHATVYRHLRAGAESGWDFSSRWCLDPQDLGTIVTTDILPVDLNCLLFQLEYTLASFYEKLEEGAKAAQFGALAERRKLAIQKYFWHEGAGFYFDYYVPGERHMPVYSLAAVFPLFMEIANLAQAERVKAILLERFLKAGGLVSTLETTGQQWDSPNGWAPLQWLAVAGFKHYGFEDEAKEIGVKWLELLNERFAQDKKLLEKYDVLTPQQTAGGGEYGVQEGFGWTNGVTLRLLKLYRDAFKD
ncbi:MAG: alpha,alpha-trehalase TreF [Trueperaceae bacterium]|nr:alpha,alpha-trehalase TreF [Trueperaceae bacterium]